MALENGDPILCINCWCGTHSICEISYEYYETVDGLDRVVVDYCECVEGACASRLTLPKNRPPVEPRYED
jgi:hypothetical protein